ncbi:hypothetical protein Bpfe_025939 [Biomphalaria pfeifferi]|uniref:Uncharacterized protein n=1 Tax=Biomphalaria pfeifferi TaxID=112525 RepID=A0AAD8AYA4_BIOPF|nr:hypothetical protein Bpfe_025939 [Biomphalaria pfeifferi]
MDTKTLFVIVLFVVSANAECYTSCSKAYIQSVMSHPSSQTLICNDIESYVHCLFGSGCNLGSVSEKEILDMMNQYLKKFGFSCSFSTTDLYNKYKNSSSTVSTICLPILLLISACLIKLKQLF